MGIFTSIINHDELLAKTNGHEPIIVNDIQDQTTEQKQALNQTLYVVNNDSYTNVPRCQCGQLQGKYRLGMTCDNCNTEVKETVEEFLEPVVYLRAPQGVSKFINPKIWMLLRKHFSKGRGQFDLIRYLTDSYYEPGSKSSSDVQSIIRRLEEDKLNIRSYNHFVDNFDMWMDYLFELPEFKQRINGPKAELYDLIKSNKDKVFSNYIPVLNKSLLVVEETTAGAYIDKQLTILLDAVRLIVGIDVYPNLDLKPQARQSRVSRMLSLLTDFYDITYKELFNKKSGHLRRHLYGTRSDYSFRTVITSIAGPHRYDEIHIPWSVACNVFELHLYNKLFQRGWAPRQIKHYLNKYSMEYHELLDELFKELIAEAKEVTGVGVPVLSNRNPSLGRGSIMLQYITGVKTNVHDVSTSISPLTTRNQNADFDGDSPSVIIN